MVFPFKNIWYWNTFRRNSALANGLAARGHNVTLLSPDVDKYPPKGVHYIHLEGLYSVEYNGILKIWFNLKNKMSPLTAPNIFNEYQYSLCKSM